MYIISDECIVYDDKKGILYRSNEYEKCKIYLDEMKIVEKEKEEFDTNYEDFLNQTMLPDEKYMQYDEEIGKSKEVITHSPTINEGSKEITDLIINNPTLPIFCSVSKNENVKYGSFYGSGYAEWRIQQTCGAIVTKVILYHGEILIEKEDLEEKIYCELHDKYENMYKDEKDYELNEYYYDRECYEFLEKLADEIANEYDKYWIDAIVIFIEY